MASSVRKPDTAKLDAINLRILSEIQRDDRITKLKFAEKVGL